MVVSNFFTPISKKEKVVEKLAWRIVDSTLVTGKYTATGEGLGISSALPDGKRKIKIAAFDFVCEYMRHQLYP
jgi:hypothetical protein